MARIFKRMNLTPAIGIGRFRVRLEFKLQDLWVGAFWQTKNDPWPGVSPFITEIWVCVVPMFPIHVGIWRASDVPSSWSLPA